MTAAAAACAGARRARVSRRRASDLASDLARGVLGLERDWAARGRGGLSYGSLVGMPFSSTVLSRPRVPRPSRLFASRTV